MEDIGWISIHRKIQESNIWDVPEPFDRRSAWVDLLLSVNHEDNRFFFDGKIITVKRGQKITSIRKLAEHWKWSVKKTMGYLNLLEMEQMITKESDRKKTLITIVNYEEYQDRGNTKETQRKRKGNTEETPREEKGDTDCTQTINNKYILSIENFFESVWQLYPRKEGKSGVTKKAKEEIEKVGYERIAKAIKKYSAMVEGKDKQYILMGSTFFNGRYRDYLDEEPVKPKQEPEEEQHEITYEEMMAMDNIPSVFGDEQ